MIDIAISIAKPKKEEKQEERQEEKKAYSQVWKQPLKDIEATQPIPYFRQFSKELNPVEIAVLGVIYQNWGAGDIGCTLTNVEIAQYFHSTGQWISNCVCRLRDKGVISVQIEGVSGGQRKQRRIFCIAKLDR